MPPDSLGRRGLGALLLGALLVPLRALAQEGDESCPAGSSGEGCLLSRAAGGDAVSCKAKGFNPSQLSCKTCAILEKRLQEAGGSLVLVEECRECCQEAAEVEKFAIAKLICDASVQEKDQDLHDFIKRKAPFFPELEVEYAEGAKPAIEFEMEESDRIVRADVSGWESDHIFHFLTDRLEKGFENSTEATNDMGTAGAWTAEIQTCSGCRLNQLPEARKFIKEPGQADTYKGLKINFIPGHNPDLVFFNKHGEEIERLDMGSLDLEAMHKLIQDKGFKRKRARTYTGEIRTCSGCRLNQLPEVRRFVLHPGNADSYIGMKINFIPHHSPVLVLLDEDGGEKEEIDIADFTYDGLHELFQKHGFRRKELL